MQGHACWERSRGASLIHAERSLEHPVCVKHCPDIQLLLGTFSSFWGQQDRVIHLPATIPKQLSGVHGHMKQRAVIILPLADKAEEQAGRAPGWDSCTRGEGGSSHGLWCVPRASCHGCHHPCPTRTRHSSQRENILPRRPGGEQLGTARWHGSTEHVESHLCFSHGDAYDGTAHLATAFAQPPTSRLPCLQVSTEFA